jgi:CheY-like chemotaxis protein
VSKTGDDLTQATLLIIDDDVSALARMAEQLSAAGYIIAKATDVRHAAQLCEERQPNAVLLEVDIERGAGWELLPKLAVAAPVIVVSIHGREEDVVRGFAAGAADYIAKPFRSAELLARVRARVGAPVEAPAAEQSVGTPTIALSAPVSQLAVEPTRPSTASRGPRRLGEDDGSEPVFMPYTDERALLSQPDHSAPIDIEPSEDMPLGPRLYLARHRRRITLVQAESELNIRMYYLQAMEEEKFMLLPSGSIAESFLVKYAEFLGLDVPRAREEYRQHHRRDKLVPPPNLGGSPLPRTVPRWLVWLLAVALAVAVCVGAILWLDPQGASTIVQNVRELLP